MTEQGSQSIEVELAKKIRAEITSQLAKWVVGIIAALIVAAALGWWFYLYPIIVKLIGGVPSNAVVAFDTAAGKCPEGWEVLPDAVGRVIVGAASQGVGNNDETGAPIAAPAFRNSGGRASVVIQPENLPPLAVAVAWRYSNVNIQNGGYQVVRHLGTAGADGGNQEPFQVGNGQSRPIATAMPFFALTMCKKG